MTSSPADAADVHTEVQPDATKDREHIVCDCRRFVTYCGAYDPGPISEMDIDGTECPQCLEVWREAACPNCGCLPDQECHLCGVL